MLLAAWVTVVTAVIGIMIVLDEATSGILIWNYISPGRRDYGKSIARKA
ncbi:UNVERIFIED_CONTAM: hypothetical protein DES50_11034 [Williamsia faeni]